MSHSQQVVSILTEGKLGVSHSQQVVSILTEGN